VLDLDSHGVEIVGQIDSGLPALGAPEVPAARVMLVGFAEGLGAAKTYAARHHYEVDANRELVGLGAANLGSGLSSGMVVNGSLSKTAVNGSAGARSQVSGLVVAVLTILTLPGRGGDRRRDRAGRPAGPRGAVPDRDPPAPRHLRHRRRPDFIAAVAALAGVLIFDTLPGLFIGIAVSLLLLYRVSRPMWPSSARSRACPASTATCSATPRTSRRRAEVGAALPRAYPTVQDAVAAVAGPESPGTG
jgi:sulfate permease, SulP family